MPHRRGLYHTTLGPAWEAMSDSDIMEEVMALAEDAVDPQSDLSDPFDDFDHEGQWIVEADDLGLDFSQVYLDSDGESVPSDRDFVLSACPVAKAQKTQRSLQPRQPKIRGEIRDQHDVGKTQRRRNRKNEKRKRLQAWQPPESSGSARALLRRSLQTHGADPDLWPLCRHGQPPCECAICNALWHHYKVDVDLSECRLDRSAELHGHWRPDKWRPEVTLARALAFFGWYASQTIMHPPHYIDCGPPVSVPPPGFPSLLTWMRFSP